MSRIAVIGAGAWGTTLSLLLAEKGQRVVLWAYEKELVAQMRQFRENKTFLPGFSLPESIGITGAVEDTKEAEFYCFAVPTQFLRSTAQKFAGVIPTTTAVISASKGIEEKTLNLPLEILKAELANSNLACLSGPNLSSEIAKGFPAASVVASQNAALAKKLQAVLSAERFRVYTNPDIVGVQLGGALKNVVAIAAGVLDGLGLGDNAKAGLMIRGIAEIARLGAALGAKPQTFAGLSGMGDLITTCSSRLSRNHFVGEQIAKGRKLSSILKEMKEVAEGVATTVAAVELAKKLRVEVPIAGEVYNLLYKDKDPYEAITRLMARTPTSE